MLSSFKGLCEWWVGVTGLMQKDSYGIHSLSGVKDSYAGVNLDSDKSSHTVTPLNKATRKWVCHCIQGKGEVKRFCSSHSYSVDACVTYTNIFPIICIYLVITGIQACIRKCRW